MKLMNLSRGYPELRRHLFSVIGTVTPRKVLNSIRCYLDFRAKRPALSGRPVFAKFEIATVCNLKCPGCLHGAGGDKDMKKEMMSLEVFKKSFDMLYPYLFKAILYHQGESFLNNDVFEMIRYAASKRVHTSISTNFSYNFSDRKIEQIVDSGLTHLILSVDGITQETYEKYRHGGNLKQVMENLTRVIEMKKKRRRKTPLVEFQYIIFDHNKDQLEEAQVVSKRLGVDRFSTKTDKIYQQGKVMGGDNTKIIAFDESKLPACRWPWFGTLIKADGSVMPCCKYSWNIDIEKNALGNIQQDHFSRVWNSEEYQISRKVLTSNEDTLRYLDQSVCTRCPAWNHSKTGAPGHD